jgi:hypothetical protein
MKRERVTIRAAGPPGTPVRIPEDGAYGIDDEIREESMTEKFETWAIVDLFGHQQIAGKASEEVIAGGSFLRVDVPETTAAEAFTRFFGAGAIYSITPVAEEIARRAAEQVRREPITVWMPDFHRALPAGVGELEDDFQQ